MISAIKGIVSRFGIHTVFIDTGTIEYEIFIPLNVSEFLKKNPKNKKIKLYIYHYFQTEEEKLYGFLDFSQRELFRTLMKLKGIGPGLALSILSHMDTPRLLEICEKKDIKSLEKIPRIGKFIAEKIIFEVNLRKKEFLKLMHEKSSSKIEDIYAIEDAVQGLLQLGYKEKNIRKIINKIKLKGVPLPENSAQWIREILKEL